MMSSALEAVHISVGCAVLGVAVTAAESLWHWSRGHYDRGGIWPWHIMREIYTERVGDILTPLMVNRSVAFVFAARIVCAGLVLLSYAQASSAVVPLGALVATQGLLVLRARWGGEGADQMTTILLIGGLMAEMFRSQSPVATSVALFVGAQITLSYLASGGAKMFGAPWREGTALTRVMNHHNYGHPWLSRVLSGYPLLGRAACAAVIGFQVSFLLFYLLPMPYALIYPAAGVMFHLGIAYFMRLNLFFVTFVGTYPCLIFTHQVVHGFLAGLV
jgi:hypothetical protein